MLDALEFIGVIAMFIAGWLFNDINRLRIKERQEARE